jgi:serine/threonine-protein kinase
MPVRPDAPTIEQARCPVCGRPVDPADTVCRYCGAGLPTAQTIATPPDAAPVPVPGATEELAEELREALAPRIQLLRTLGEGGMGHVWLGRDPALKRLVAVKVLHPELANDPTSRARFGREAEAAAAVQHPGVVSVYQVGELPRSGTTYFVMQYVEGKSLLDEVKPGEAMPEPRVRRIVGEIAAALAAAHARGLVHRDIKPANVMLDAESGRVVVLDFGISAALERRATPAATRLTAEGHSIGTPMYMSPEQAAASEVTPKSDVYSLGVVAFELATGRPPFAGTTPMELVAAHIKDVPPRIATLRPDVDPQLAELIDRCLAKDPGKRPAAADIARALQPAAHALIEWPPPGLEPLRGQGADLAATMGAAAGVALLFFLILRAQPILLLPGWYVERFMAFDGTPIWYFSLGMCLVTLLILVALVAMRAWHVADRARRGRRSGYPWSVLLDVAWDQRPDTGALLNGLGAYALVEPALRHRLMELRRRQAAFAAATIVVAVLSPLLWLAGLTGGWAGNLGPLMPGPEVLVVFLPVLAGLAGLSLSARPEAQLHARLGASQPRGTRDEPPVRAELVGAWLAAAGRASGGAARRVPRLAMAAVPTVLALALLVGAATVLAVSFVVSRALTPARDDARDFIRTMRTDSLRPMAWQRFDSLIGAAARLPDTRSEPDLEGARLALSAALEAPSLHPAWIAESTEVARWALDSPLAGGSFRAMSVLRRLPGAIPDSDLMRLARDTMTPRLAAWRRLARTGPLPLLWPYRSGIPGARHVWTVPGWELIGPARGFAERNNAAIALAAARGDKATALVRAREVIAVGRALMRIPLPEHAWWGRWLSDQGGRLLIEIGRVTADPVVGAEGERLRSLVDRSLGPQAVWSWQSASRALAADPSGRGLAPYLGDTAMAPYRRILGATALAYGYCYNVREVLFGVDPRRRGALAQADSALRDLPRADELVRLMRNDLDELIAHPGAAFEARGGTLRPGVARPFGWIGLRGVRDRLAICGLLA